MKNQRAAKHYGWMEKSIAWRPSRRAPREAKRPWALGRMTCGSLPATRGSHEAVFCVRSVFALAPHRPAGGGAKFDLEQFDLRDAPKSSPCRKDGMASLMNSMTVTGSPPNLKVGNWQSMTRAPGSAIPSRFRGRTEYKEYFSAAPAFSW
jgi:hypothetical protein